VRTMATIGDNGLESKEESRRKTLQSSSPGKKSRRRTGGSMGLGDDLAAFGIPERDLRKGSLRRSLKSDSSIPGDKKNGKKKKSKRRTSDDSSVQTEATGATTGTKKKSSKKKGSGDDDRSVVSEATTPKSKRKSRRGSDGTKDSTGKRRESANRDTLTRDLEKLNKAPKRRGRAHSSATLGGKRSTSTPPLKATNNPKPNSRSMSTSPTRGGIRRGGLRSSANQSASEDSGSGSPNKTSTRTPKRSVKRVLSSSDFLQSPRADRFTLTTSLSMRATQQEQEDNRETLNALVYKLKDPSLEETLTALFRRIEHADGFTSQGKPEFGNNHIAFNMEKIIRNDPDITTLRVDGDQRFRKVKKSLTIQFAEALRTNLHVTSIIIRDVGLEDRFLIALADSLQENFTLRTIILSYNSFTSEGLVEFCHALAANQSLTTIDLSHQKRPLEKHSEREALEALMENRFLQTVQMDVTTEKCKGLIQMIEDRNGKAMSTINYDKKLIRHFQREADTAEQLFQLNILEEKVKHLTEKDQVHLYNLVQIAELQNIEAKSHEAEKLPEFHPKVIYSPDKMKADGSFLNSDFIANYLFDDPTAPGLIFSLNHDFALFRAFDRRNPARQPIVQKFVDVLVEHERAKEITKIICKDAVCTDDFVQALCEKSLGNAKVLPKLIMVDFERNFVSDAGLKFLSRCLEDKRTWRYLQTLKLDKQFSVETGKKIHFTLESEFALTKALCVNISLLRLSLKIRHPAIRKKLSNYLSRNLDLVRQVRARVLDEEDESAANNTARGELERIVDRVSENDPTLWDLGIESADQRFISLRHRDKLQLARGLANNKFLTEIRLESLGLDDEFASILGGTLAINTTIRILNLDGNRISGRGIKAIFGGIAKNNTVTEVQILQQQADPMNAEEEDAVQDALMENHSIVQVGLYLGVSESVLEAIRAVLTRNHRAQWDNRRKLSLE